jgi:hypothetical protein
MFLFCNDKQRFHFPVPTLIKGLFSRWWVPLPAAGNSERPSSPAREMPASVPCVSCPRLPLWSSESSWLQNRDVLCFLWGTNWIYTCYIEGSRLPLWSSESSWLQNGDVLCFLWGTNWIYTSYIEGSRLPLWSSGQSSWPHNGDVLCFLWGTNWIYICYVEESRPPLWTSGQSSWPQNGDVLCFLWGTNWIYICYVEGCGRLCSLVVRVLGYRSGGPGSIPGTTKKNSGSGTGSTQPREYNWKATW